MPRYTTRSLLETLRHKDAAFIVVTDGSGSMYYDKNGSPAPGGAAAMVKEVGTGRRPELLKAAMAPCTSQVAEIFACIIGLSHVAYLLGEGRKGPVVPQACRNVALITDSLNLVRQFNGAAKRKKLAPWWTIIDRLITETGMVVKFHHVNRDLLAANRLCDKIAGIMRIAVTFSDAESREATEGMLDRLLPDED